VIAGLAFWNQPAWLFMWALVVMLGLALKWLSWSDAIAHGACPSPKRAFAWFLLWPGMDGRAFFAENEGIKQSEPRERFWAVALTSFGAGVLWVLVPHLLPQHPLAAAWAGMIGIVVFLHFGAFRLLSVLFRLCGVNTGPIMNAPLRATSLAEFWGARWNTAFSIPIR
jgi:hypothetical protein